MNSNGGDIIYGMPLSIPCQKDSSHDKSHDFFTCTHSFHFRNSPCQISSKIIYLNLWDVCQRVEDDVGCHMSLNLKVEGLYSFSTHKCGCPFILACLESNLAWTLSKSILQGHVAPSKAATSWSKPKISLGSIWFD